jgi:hypothetical protein
VKIAEIFSLSHCGGRGYDDSSYGGWDGYGGSNATIAMATISGAPMVATVVSTTIVTTAADS